MANTLYFSANGDATTKIVQFYNPVLQTWVDGTLVDSATKKYTATMAGIPAGTYTGLKSRLKGSSPEIVSVYSEGVIVRDGNTIPTPTALTLTFTIASTTAAAGNSLSYSAAANGGTAPYQHLVQAENEDTGAVTQIGSASTPNYAGIWQNLPVGKYALTDTVTDAASATKISPVRRVVISAASAGPLKPLRITPFGNSITNGGTTSAISAAWANQAKVLLAGLATFTSTTQLGFPGKDIEFLQGIVNGGGLPAVDPAFDCWVLLQEFTNSRYNSDETMYAAMKALIASIKQLGYKVAVWTPTPRQDSAINYDYINNKLRNDADLDMVLDICQHQNFNETTDASNPAVYYQVDKLHPNDGGHTIMAHLVYDAFATGARSGIKITQYQLPVAGITTQNVNWIGLGNADASNNTLHGYPQGTGLSDYGIGPAATDIIGGFSFDVANLTSEAVIGANINAANSSGNDMVVGVYLQGNLAKPFGNFSALSNAVVASLTVGDTIKVEIAKGGKVTWYKNNVQFYSTTGSIPAQRLQIDTSFLQESTFANVKIFATNLQSMSTPESTFAAPANGLLALYNTSNTDYAGGSRLDSSGKGAHMAFQDVTFDVRENGRQVTVFGPDIEGHQAASGRATTSFAGTDWTIWMDFWRDTGSESDNRALAIIGTLLVGFWAKPQVYVYMPGVDDKTLPGTVSSNAWHRLIIKGNSATNMVTISVDGVVLGTAAGTWRSDSPGLQYGAFGAGSPFRGKIGFSAVYARQTTDAEDAVYLAATDI